MSLHCSAAAAPPPVKVVEQHRVSPPPASIPPATLPLTFFDVLWHFAGPVQRLLFYHDPNVTTTNFVTSHFPALRHSLSLALRTFYSLAGAVVSSPKTDTCPVISYSDGDSVPFLLAEADPSYFSALVSDDAKDVVLMKPFVPPLPAADELGQYRLFAAQVTVFPGAGFSLGVSIHHVAADGSSYTRFLKAWAAIHRSGGDLLAVSEPPVYDRGALLHLEEEKKSFHRELEQLQPVMDDSLTELRRRASQLGRVVVATFVLTRSDIDKLRNQILSGTSERPSTFVTVVSYVWTCLTKARGHNDRTVYFAFNADFRSRVDPRVADAYFGNCISASICEANGSDLCHGIDGLIVAAKAVQERIRSLGGGVVEKMRDTIAKMARLFSERVLTVAGSPTFLVYEIDFGWGPPKKVEQTSIAHTGAMSMAESRGGLCGVEIGLAGPDTELDLFGRLFREGLEGQ